MFINSAIAASRCIDRSAGPATSGSYFRGGFCPSFVNPATLVTVISIAGNWRCEFEVDNIDYPETGEHVVIKDRVRLMARGWRYP